MLFVLVIESGAIGERLLMIHQEESKDQNCYIDIRVILRHFSTSGLCILRSKSSNIKTIILNNSKKLI